MCIRSFSKKSRSMNINVSFMIFPHNLNLFVLIFYAVVFANVRTWCQVPDFDSVTCMVAMPKNLVGCIRRSIELSHSILADSSSHNLQKPARGKSRQVCP